MDNRKIYHTPSAELMLLMPCEDISDIGKNNSWWGYGNGAWWGTRPQNASVVTGTLLIPDEDGNSWTLP